jgi:hypothetical protein
MQKLAITHARNWQESRCRVGSGHLYQGRYKSFPVESNAMLRLLAVFSGAIDWVRPIVTRYE